MSAPAPPRASGAPEVRVLHVRNTDRIGGPERLLLDQCRRAAPGVVHIVAPFQTTGVAQPLLEAALEAGAVTCSIPQRHSYDRSMLRALELLLDRMSPDVVVGHDYKANWALSKTATRRGLPRVAIVHGYTAENLKIRFFEHRDRRRLRHMDAVVCVSEPQRAEFCAQGVDPERVHVIPNAIDADAVSAAAQRGRAVLRREWNIAEEQRVVRALGRLSPEKGHSVLLDAFAACGAERTNARLVLVGDGAQRAQLAERARATDLAGRVRLEGWRADPHACLGAADVFVLPSLREGLPLALLEAMAVGLPIVASAVGGIPDALGSTGSLVPPGDVAALAQALADRLRPATQHQVQPSAAARRVRERHDPTQQARALEALYESLRGAE